MMDTLRVSATDLDALRWFRDDDEAELDALLRQLRHEEPPTEAMLAGSALHKALEMASTGDHKGFAIDDYMFSFETEAEIDLPAIREMKATRDYVIDGCLVTLVGKVDAIHGKRVDDHKFTSRYDAERYMSSYQWRVYLEIFGADEFRWNVFEGRESSPRNYIIHAIHHLRMNRYPLMGEDIVRELSAFVEFARAHLPDKLRRQAA